jgi:hypothetical protein
LSCDLISGTKSHWGTTQYPADLAEAMLRWPRCSSTCIHSGYKASASHWHALPGLHLSRNAYTECIAFHNVSGAGGQCCGAQRSKSNEVVNWRSSTHHSVNPFVFLLSRQVHFFTSCSISRCSGVLMRAASTAQSGHFKSAAVLRNRPGRHGLLFAPYCAADVATVAIHHV